MNRLETNNEFTKGMIAGLIGSIIMYLFIESFRWLDLTKYGQSYIGGETVFDYNNTLLLKIIGFLLSIFIGTFWGVVMAFFFSKLFNHHNYIIKGSMFSFALFIINLGILDEFFHYPRELHKETFNVIVFFLGYVLYGSSTAIILRKLGIFEK